MAGHLFFLTPGGVQHPPATNYYFLLRKEETVFTKKLHAMVLFFCEKIIKLFSHLTIPLHLNYYLQNQTL